MFSDTAHKISRRKGLRYILVKGDDPGLMPLVLLHGMFGGLSNFDRLIGLLHGKRSIIVPEMPLYNSWNKALTVQSLSDWVFEKVIHNLQLEKVILLGNSLGGHIALDLALKHPLKTGGLILTGSSGLFEQGFGYSRPRRYDRNYIRDRASMTFYDNKVDESIIDEIQQILKSRRKLSKLLKIARSAREYNMESVLGKIQQPILLVWGRNDVITPPDVAVNFLRRLPNARLEWIDKCGHAPMMERPEEFVPYLSDFLEQINQETGGQNTPATQNEDYERERSYLQ